MVFRIYYDGSPKQCINVIQLYYTDAQKQLISGDHVETHPGTELSPNCVAEPVTKTITFTPTQAEHDGQVLECMGANSGWPTGRFDNIILNVISK